MADASPVARAVMALRLLALDPGLGGIALRARAGPVREAVLRTVAPVARLTPSSLEAALAGGLDLAATLAAGRPVAARGVLDRRGLLVLAMAERMAPAAAGRLGALLDEGRHTLVALDEGVEPDERLPAALAERLAFAVDLDGCRLKDFAVAAGALDLRAVRLPEGAAETMARIAGDLGVASLRGPLFALRAARGLAALSGRAEASADDLAEAAALTLAHRATRLPEAAEPPEAEPPSPENAEGAPAERSEIPDELVLAAVRVALPDGVLGPAAGAVRGAAGDGAGARKTGNRRGRPLPSRPGRPSGDARLDLVATLRAAAPWQRLRGAAPGRPQVRGSDLRIRCYEERSDRLVVFAVDASGSTALARLGEAKGAVELLLSQAYARRDHVALVAFRGAGAELVLPPTRSLVQAKRRLAALPGGGGTPLAAGLKAALEVAVAARRRGLTPLVALLTDGRGNVALDGTPGRGRATEDAGRVARLAAGIEAVVIDTGARPDAGLAELARVMGGRYLALPRARAEALSDALGAAVRG